ncbi:IclR family transcriptional regulator [Tissierellaceae bacterium HCP3S3_D8]
MKKMQHKPTERVLNILELLASNPEGLSLTEISNSIQSPKSTIHPILQTMAQRKFIYLNKNISKYTIGIASYCVGASYSNEMNVLDFIKSQMQYIVDHSDEICQLGILDRGEVLYIAKVDSDNPIRLMSSVGKRLPAYCTALGKALLIGKDIEEIKDLYPNGLESYTDNTITDFNVLYKEIIDCRKNNFALEKSEINNYSSCIAVPLINKSRVIAALSVSIPTFRESDEKFELAKNLLLDAKSKIETFFYDNHIDEEIFVF